jgi:TatD DNase family protein
MDPQLPELIDSHCHLEPGDFTAAGPDGPVDEREAVIARARAAGVIGLVCIGSGRSLDEVHNAVAIAECHDGIWAGVGIHPHDVARMPQGALDRIEQLATEHPKVVAVGETGLDYYYDHSPRQAQRDALAAFVGIARRARRPISLHIRDAHDDAYDLLVAERAGELGGVVHCFTGTLEDARRYVALGLHVSFSGVVTFKSAAVLREAAAWVPLDRLLIETDCPFLAPVPLRGKRNEPAYLVHTAKMVAEVRGLPLAELAAATTANARRLFGLPGHAET